LDTIIRCGTTERTAMEPPFSFDFPPLPFVPIRSGASFLICMESFWKPSPTFPVFFCYITNCSSPACNKSLIRSCQFIVALDYQTIPEKTCVDSQMTFVKFLPLFSTHHYEQWECCGTHSVRYLLLPKVPEPVYGCRCLSNPSIFHSGFVFFIGFGFLFFILADLLLLCLKSLSISQPSLNSIQVESWGEIVSNHEDICVFS